MRIALDYDDTYTADRLLWGHFVGAARAMGHTIHIVTMRAYPVDNNAELQELSQECSVIFCNGVAKEEVTEARGIHINIWIDDNPRSILHNSPLSPSEVVEWRKAHTD